MFFTKLQVMGANETEKDERMLDKLNLSTGNL
jgi:hypothetical protein